MGFREVGSMEFAKYVKLYGLIGVCKWLTG